MRLLAGLCATICCGAALAQTPTAPLPPAEDRVYQDILKAAAEPDRDVRAQAAVVTGLIGRKDALPVLQRLLADPAPIVRIAALRALPSLLPAGAAAPLKAEPPVDDPFLRAALLTAAAQFTFDGRDALVAEGINKGSPADKELALRALGLDKTAPALAVLLKALEDPNPRIRAAALAGLGSFPQPQAAEAAVKALGDPSFLVRAAACQSLGAARAKDRIAPVQRASGDESYYVRRSAVQALAAIGAPAAAASIEQRIKDPDDTVRVAACAALAVLLAPTSPAFLAPRLADPIIEVRQAAEDALLKFPPDAAWQPVMEASDHKDLRETRVRAWKLLGEYAHESTREHAFKNLAEKDGEIVGYAMRVMRKLSDERSKPHVLAVLTVAGLAKASEVDQQECFEAAILFKLRQPIPQIMRLLRLAIKPPDDFSISETALASAIKYLAAMDHKEAAPLAEQLYTAQGWSMESAKVVTAVLTAWTGKTYPLPVVAPSYGHYFIDAYVPRDKPPTP